MELYMRETLDGSPEWKRAVKRKQWERVAALADPEARKAFEAKHGHAPEIETADEYQEPRNHE